MKKIIKFTFLLIIILLIPEKVSASNLKNLPSLELPSHTILNVDENFTQLQYSKDELGDSVSETIIIIESVSYELQQVRISGYLNYGEKKKPFLIEGMYKNSKDNNRSRLIFSAKDLLGNFEILDFSFYYKTESLTIFNTDLPNWKNSSVNTLTILDKENRNLTICETIPSDELLNKQITLLNKQDTLDPALEEEIYWNGRLMKNNIQSTLKELPNLTRYYGIKSYEHVTTYNFYGDSIKDVLFFEVSVDLPDYINHHGNYNFGSARIQCTGGYNLNLTTGLKTNSFSNIGHSANTIIELYLEGENKHGFVSNQISGYVSKMPSISPKISVGVGIPNTGISIGIDWSPMQSVSLDANFQGFNNNPTQNRYSRSMQLTFDKAYKLHYSSHYLQTTFAFKNFDSTWKRDGKVTAKLRLPLYNAWTGETVYYRPAMTVKYYQ